MERARSKLAFLAILASLAAFALAAVACGSDEPEAPPTPTPVDVSGIIQQVMAAQQPGVTTEDVAAAIQAALAQQEGLTSADVANEIAKALSARPGVTSEDVASAIASALDARPGVTTQDVANEIARALSAQPGVTEAQVAAAIQAALAERPGITEDQVAAIVKQAMEAQQSEIIAAVTESLFTRLDESGAPEYGGTMTVVIRAGSATLDPAFYIETPDVTLRQNLYDNLLMIQADGSVTPELATSWETSDDVSSWTFNLRQGVKFHHGKDFKAEDVLFTFNRLLDPELNTQMAVLLNTIDEIVVLNDNTIRFDFSGPNGYFLDTLRLEGAQITPADVDVERLTVEEFGAGPFMLSEHEPGVRSVLAGNPGYWEEGKPYLDEIVYLLVPEAATRSTMLTNGVADIAHRLAIQSAPAIADHPDTSVLGAPGAWLGITMRGDTEPFDNKLVRQAMQAAADRESIVQAATLGLGVIGYDHPLSPNDAYFATQYAPPSYDPDLARSLLAQAGYPDGIDITLHTADVSPGHVEMAVAFAAGAEAAGIRVDVQRGPADTYWGGVWFVEPLSTVSWTPRGLDGVMSEVYDSASAMNVQQYFNPVLDDLIVRARGQDSEGQKQTYAEIQRILIEDVPIVITAFRPSMIGVQNHVRGVEAHPLDILILRDAWLDK